MKIRLLILTALVFVGISLTAESLSIKQTQAIQVSFPEDLDTEVERNALKNQILEFPQTLYVTSNYYLQRYGQVTLSSAILIAPTEINAPGSDEYRDEVAWNESNQITLDDGSSATDLSVLPWTGADGTLRTGESITGLRAKLTHDGYRWVLVPEGDVEFSGNPRPTALADMAKDEVRVVGFNLQHYIVSNFGSGFGPDNQAQSNKQHAKIMKTLIALNADVYALCEVQTGQTALSKLTDALNSHFGAGTYAFVNDGSNTNGSYSKVGFIYRKTKLSVVKSIQENDTQYDNRKKGQGFSMLDNGGGFIVAMNHFKAKSGSASGSNADKGDGQGTYNGARVKEAESTIRYTEDWIDYFGDNDVLIMGDLNSYSEEDPVQIIEDAGYENLLYKFADNNEAVYSYNFKAVVGLLDHAYANASMTSQVLDSYVYHVNTDEPGVFEYWSDEYYEDNMYRSSDHDPVVVEMRVNATDTSIAPPVMKAKFSRANGEMILVENASNHRIEVFNYNGVMLMSDVVDSDRQEFGIVGWSEGVYLVKLTEMKYIEPKRTTLKIIVVR